MLRDVFARCAGASVPVCEPEMALEHVRCVNALHEHVGIVDIPATTRARRSGANETFTYVAGLDAMFAEAYRRGVGLHALGLPWAVKPTEIDLSSYRGYGVRV
jgi:hypothetical protein